MNNKFKLPEKWCIKANEENWKTIGDFFNKQSKTTCYNKDFINQYYHSHNRQNHCILNIGNSSKSYVRIKEDDYVEITFEEFEEYVLGVKFINQNYDYLIPILQKLKL